MASFYWTFQYTDELIDPRGGEPVNLIPDIECEVEVDVELSHGDVTATVEAVLIDGWDLRRGTEQTRALATTMIAAAQDEIDAGGRLWDRIVEEERLVRSGRGPGDPDAHWSRAA